MFDWKILALTVPLLFAIYQTLSKVLPKDISIFLVNAYASFIGLIIMLSLHLVLSPNKSLMVNPKYLPIILGIGLLIGLGNFGIIKAYSSGAPQSIFTPIFYLVLIIYGTLCGILIWHEKLNFTQIAGLGLLVSGFFLIIHAKK